MFEIKNTGNYALTNGVKIMNYARSGIGKTFLCTTLPEPLVLSAENGILSIRKYNLPYIEIKTIAQLEEVYQWLAYTQESWAYHYQPCVDSITEVADAVLLYELSKAKDPRQAYGMVMARIAAVFRAFRDMPRRHVYFVAQQEYSKDEVSGLKMYQPAFPGNKLGQQVPYFFDETFQMLVDRQGTRWLRTRPDFQNEAKDRSGMLAEYEPANLTHIISKILA